VIIDFHVHLFPPEVVAQREKFLERDPWFNLLYANPKAAMATVEDLIQAMDEAGVDKAVVFGFSWCDVGLCVETNEYTLEAMRRYPERLIGFCNVNPTTGEHAVREIRRCVEAGMCGIGELMPNGQGFSLDDVELMAPIAAAARAYDIPIMTHTSEPIGHDYAGKGTVSPRVVYRFVQAFPEIKLVCSHWGGGLPFYELMPEVRRAMRNVYYDTAASPLLYEARIFPLMYELVGHKILFATDFALIHPKRLIAHIRESGLSEEGQRAVLGENARRLLTCLHQPGA
jgi:predicted TIM-barrel fold metal-dependent hydrolase